MFPFASSMTAFTSSTPLKSDKSIEFLSNSVVSSPSTITYIFVNDAASGPTTLALLPTTTIVGFFNQPKSRSVGSPVAKHPIPQKRNSASVVSFPKLTSGKSPLGLRSLINSASSKLIKSVSITSSLPSNELLDTSLFALFTITICLLPDLVTNDKLFLTI